MEDEVDKKMKARVPDKSAMQKIQEEYDRSLQAIREDFNKKLKEMQEEYDRCLAINTENAQNNAIKLCVVTGTASFVDMGFAESSITKFSKRWKSYIDSVRKGTVELQEVIDTLEEEEDISFDWMGEK